jgi:hypothetical protein
MPRPVIDLGWGVLGYGSVLRSRNGQSSARSGIDSI